jgi:hypothetical protein
VVPPFTKDYELDEVSLSNTVRFCLRAGVRGLVGPGDANDFSTLSDDERRRWIEIIVAEGGGQVPVLASTTSGYALPAVAISRYARKIGASAIMSIPPDVQHQDAARFYAHYKALLEPLDIPIMVQNFIGPIGAPMSPDLLAHMCRELPQLLTFLTWLLRSFIPNIPPSLEESAIIDGCSRFQAMWYVVAPSPRPALASVAILDFLTVCNDFLIAFTLTISETRRTIQTGLYQMITDWDIEWGPMMVATITAIIPTVAIYFSSRGASFRN